MKQFSSAVAGVGSETVGILIPHGSTGGPFNLRKVTVVGESGDLEARLVEFRGHGGNPFKRGASDHNRALESVALDGLLDPGLATRPIGPKGTILGASKDSLETGRRLVWDLEADPELGTRDGLELGPDSGAAVEITAVGGQQSWTAELEWTEGDGPLEDVAPSDEVGRMVAYAKERIAEARAEPTGLAERVDQSLEAAAIGPIESYTSDGIPVVDPASQVAPEYDAIPDAEGTNRVDTIGQTGDSPANENPKSGGAKRGKR